MIGAVSILSSRQGNENSSCGFKSLLGLKVRRGRNGDLGNKRLPEKTCKGFDNQS